jgi:adenine-specific DNA-methyltransferase
MKKTVEVEALTHKEAKRRNIPTAEFESLMRDEDKSPVQKAYQRRNRDLDPQLEKLNDGTIRVKTKGIDVFKPQSGEIESGGPETIALWMIDTDYNEESFFVRHAYFLGANDPYKALKTTLKAEIDEEAWASLNSDTSRPFPKPASGRIAVKVINHLGDEVMKVFSVA